jgi:hypothetical protein
MNLRLCHRGGAAGRVITALGFSDNTLETAHANSQSITEENHIARKSAMIFSSLLDRSPVIGLLLIIQMPDTGDMR